MVRISYSAERDEGCQHLIAIYVHNTSPYNTKSLAWKRSTLFSTAVRKLNKGPCLNLDSMAVPCKHNGTNVTELKPSPARRRIISGTATSYHVPRFWLNCDEELPFIYWCLSRSVGLANNAGVKARLTSPPGLLWCWPCLTSERWISRATSPFWPCAGWILSDRVSRLIRTFSWNREKKAVANLFSPHPCSSVVNKKSAAGISQLLPCVLCRSFYYLDLSPAGVFRTKLKKTIRNVFARDAQTASTMLRDGMRRQF